MKKIISGRWILSSVTGATAKLQDITNIPIGGRNAWLSEKEKILFRKEILRLKKLGVTANAANDYGG